MPPIPLRLSFGSPLLALALSLVLVVPATLSAQQAPLTLRDEGGEVNILADSIQQVGGTTNLLIAIGGVEITSEATRMMADRFNSTMDFCLEFLSSYEVFFDGEDRL